MTELQGYLQQLHLNGKPMPKLEDSMRTVLQRFGNGNSTENLAEAHRVLYQLITHSAKE